MSAEAAAGDHAKSAREGAPPSAVQSRWRSLWARMPKPVLMVLFGAAVSAWLVPAFTRQWQDRQKEREIKVALVSEISDSTSDTLFTSQSLAGQTRTNGQEEYNRIWLDWLGRSAQLEARLEAYFPGQALVGDWHKYSIVVENGLYLVTSGVAGKEQAVGIVRKYLASTEDPVTIAEADWDLLRGRFDSGNSDAVQAYVDVAFALSAGGRTLIRRILEANAAGFSTTRGDLIDDLTPFN
jgi:hypothetical protein